MTGGADVRAERQTAYEVGAEFWLGGSARRPRGLEAAIRNQGDPNVFFGTTVIFPNAVDRGDARGLDVRLEVPRRAASPGS